MVDIEIDGKQLQVEQGSMVIEAADKAGIPIPRFCYHKHLSIAANCRMCLVEVEKMGKPLPACATPVTPGMKVFTKSPMAIDAQKSVMEFLLINHPLDCPICDQGGECELQDVSMGYGKDVSRFTEGKRSVKDKDLGSLVATDFTRCIHCTRCVRFGQEIAGIRELGATGRGEHTEIGTYVEHAMQSEVSGNIIDLCPVGALTSKPFRFRARAWELNQADSIAAHDCLGSNIHIHTRRNDVMRVVPKEQAAINQTWLSDRDRFSYEGIYSHDRLQQPLIKQDGQWHMATWPEALNVVAKQLTTLQQEKGPDSLAAISSPSATTEEQYLLQKLMRGLGSHNIDHRIRQTDFADQAHMPAYPKLGMAIADIESQDSILLIGSNIQQEQPIAGLWVAKAAKRGAVMCVNPVDYDFNFPVQHKVIAQPGQLVQQLAAIAKALNVTDSLVANVHCDGEHKAIAEQLKSGEKSAIILGSLAMNHPQASEIRYLAHVIADAASASVGVFSEGANSAGACLAGATPHRTAGAVALEQGGLDAKQLLNTGLSAYVLMGVELEDFANPVAAKQSLQQADLVVSISPFRSETIDDVADVILPMATFAETSGTYVNCEGLWQSFQGASAPYGESRPGWKVLRVMANLLNLDGFDYTSSEDVLQELKATIDSSDSAQYQPYQPTQLSSLDAELTRIAPWPIYRVDALVRRSLPLQKALAMDIPAIHLNDTTAAKYQLKAGDNAEVSQGEHNVELPVFIDNRIPNQSIMVAASFPETLTLNEPFGPITLKRS